jgi:YfiH family protein
MTPGYVPADWAAPPGVRAGVTTRAGGVSAGPRATLNLGSHVGDDPAAVAENRRRVRESLALPSEPLWLQQVHGTDVVVHDGSAALAREAAGPRADAAVAFEPGRVLAVLTADCLPVVLASRDGARLGVAHAGWRGLAGGVVENTVAALGVRGDELVAWLGPAIGPAAFEVGPEVREAFVADDAAASSAFAPNARGRWQADLYALARRRLARLGVRDVAGGGACTYTDAERWFSFRRDRDGGRMATLAWLAPR